jgi:hypothetical protein
MTELPVQPPTPAGSDQGATQGPLTAHTDLDARGALAERLVDATTRA